MEKYLLVIANNNDPVQMHYNSLGLLKVNSQVTTYIQYCRFICWALLHIESDLIAALVPEDLVLK